MIINSVKLKKDVNPDEVVNQINLICCIVGEGDNVAHLVGDEISNIHPHQEVQSLPILAAKILSQIARKGLCFHVARRGDHTGVFIARNRKLLLNAA